MPRAAEKARNRVEQPRILGRIVFEVGILHGGDVTSRRGKAHRNAPTIFPTVAASLKTGMETDVPALSGGRKVDVPPQGRMGQGSVARTR